MNDDSAGVGIGLLVVNVISRLISLSLSLGRHVVVVDFACGEEVGEVLEEAGVVIVLEEIIRGREMVQMEERRRSSNINAFGIRIHDGLEN